MGTIQRVASFEETFLGCKIVKTLEEDLYFKRDKEGTYSCNLSYAYVLRKDNREAYSLWETI